MILTAFHGFCMALADSVPGVSGGTLASIPLIAAADFALGVITCMVIRKIPGVRILFGL